MTTLAQMKVTLAPVKGANYTIHDGCLLLGQVTARCMVISVRQKRWHMLEGHATTTCKRCLTMRKER